MSEVITRFRGGEYCNCYILGNEHGCIIIDDGYDKDGFLTGFAKTKFQKIWGLFLTHGHFDHILGLNDSDIDFPIFISSEDEPCLYDGFLNGSIELGLGNSIITKQISPYLVEDEDEIKVGPFLVKAIATPFHTYGSMCFYLEQENLLFSGDTLFYRGVGRYDLKHSCPRFLEKSLHKLSLLPKETIVYPGHGKKTRLGEELAFLKVD